MVGLHHGLDPEETDDAYVIEVEAPSVNKRDIDVSVAGRRSRANGRRGSGSASCAAVPAASAGSSTGSGCPATSRNKSLGAELADGMFTVRAPQVDHRASLRIEVT